jgi:uncharacterized protein (TIGR02246 family)
MANSHNTGDEQEIRELVENWADAVRRKDFEGILSNHSPDILMFDVPPPHFSKGIDEYRKTWDLFFSASPEAPAFDFQEMNITVGGDVAFVAALMHCLTKDPGGNYYPLDFRLTIGLRKLNARWTIVHEHHSIPATN